MEAVVKKNFVSKKLILKKAIFYIAMKKMYPKFLNNMYCLSKLSLYNIFEKLEIAINEVENSIIVVVTSRMFRVFIKGLKDITVYHNENVYKTNSNISIRSLTHSFSVYINHELIITNDSAISKKNTLNERSIFAYINIHNACMNEKSSQNLILELIRIKGMIERLLSFYTCEIANTDLEYIIVRFDDPLKIVHFIDKLTIILEGVYIGKYGNKEKLLYSIGVSYGMYEKLYDFTSSCKFSYCGIALNLCARLAKLGENKVFICSYFYKIVKDQLKYLNYGVNNIGEQPLKGFDVQDIYILSKLVFS